MNHLSLFSGYEGFGLGLRLAGIPIRTVGYVEVDEYCQQLLQARIRDGYLDWAPIIRDIRCADFRPMAGLVDIITAGFPCQPHSFAGKRLGADDERNLWPDTLRTIGEVGPDYVLLENTPGILSNGYAGTVVGQLSEIGYDARWAVVSAADVGAPHRRERWWCLAHSNNGRCAGQWRAAQQECQHQAVEWGQHTGTDGEDRPMADADSQREPQPEGGIGDEWGRSCDSSKQMADATHNGRTWAGDSWTRRDGPADGGSDGPHVAGIKWWNAQSTLDRVVNGYPHRVAELKALGNGIVPAVVREFLRR